MAIREVPSSYEYICDGCKTTETQAHKSQPKYWCELIFAQPAYDFQGCAVADGTIKRLLCADCTKAAADAVNAAIEARRSLTGVKP